MVRGGCPAPPELQCPTLQSVSHIPEKWGQGEGAVRATNIFLIIIPVAPILPLLIVAPLYKWLTIVPRIRVFSFWGVVVERLEDSSTQHFFEASQTDRRPWSSHHT